MSLKKNECKLIFFNADYSLLLFLARPRRLGQLSIQGGGKISVELGLDKFIYFFGLLFLLELDLLLLLDFFEGGLQFVPVLFSQCLFVDDVAFTN